MPTGWLRAHMGGSGLSYLRSTKTARRMTDASAGARALRRRGFGEEEARSRPGAAEGGARDREGVSEMGIGRAREMAALEEGFEGKRGIEGQS